ncbi:hypothetical protein L1049_021024 [Liquidambar formosana]|uniref:Angiotensin-converting enzyme 2 n=1 Tax=Liquidambar formosana TaxID=63359 RepID=A0AAP0S949_LIQFO
MKTEQELQGAAEIQSSTEVSHEPHSGQQNTADAPVTDSISSSKNEGRKVSHEEIELVQNLIERCLQLYMDRDEVVKTLLNRARIEPGFTTLVWQKLEEENADFFKAYYIRLNLKQQIIMFNQLLEQQYYLMNHQVPPKVPLPPIQNGIHHMPVNNLPMGYPVMRQPPIPATGQPQIDSMHCNMSTCHVVNGIPAPGNFHPIRMSSRNATVMDGSAADSVPHNTTTVVKSEMAFSPASVASNGHFPFTQSKISGLSVDASALDSTFTSDMTSSEGFQLGLDNGTGMKESLSLGSIPWNLSLSDLTVDLPNFEDLGMVENYSGSEILLDSPEHNDIVGEFFVDSVPGTGSQSDEEKS